MFTKRQNTINNGAPNVAVIKKKPGFPKLSIIKHETTSEGSVISVHISAWDL